MANKVAKTTTKGRKQSSYRVTIPSEIVRQAGLRADGEPDHFVVIHDPKRPNTITLIKLDMESLVPGE